MAGQNRVAPLGELVADPARGLVYGNRGCLHDAQGRIVRNYDGQRWIACLLAFRDRHREPLMQPGRYTGALLSRRGDGIRGRPPSVRALPSRRLCAVSRAARRAGRGPRRRAAARRAAQPRTRRLHNAAIDDLPDGAFVLRDGAPHLVLGTKLLEWTPGGYVAARPRRDEVSLITPPSLITVLQRGWQGDVALLHPSASRLSSAAPRASSGSAARAG